MYAERLKKAIGWYSQPEIQDGLRKPRMAEITAELAQLEEEEHRDKKRKRGNAKEHGGEHDAGE
jgi:hypothetical protein